MKTNRPNIFREKTHQGGPAARSTPEKELRRAVLSCLLWEDTFYEKGDSIAARIAALVPEVDPIRVGLLAVDAREQFKLRHAPLWLAVSMLRAGGLHRQYAGAVIEEVIQRADELSELLSLYWKDGRCKLASQLKRGLAAAFQKFNAYQLAKYNRDGAVKLRDVLFLCHPTPKDAEQEATWKRLVDGTLEAPDTWEVELSKGQGAKSAEEKRDRWARLLAENKLGAMALLRNLRNMLESGIPQASIEKALSGCNPERVLPYRFIAAARAAPRLEPALEPLMLQCLSGREQLRGRTTLLVDHSGSMRDPLSQKSDLTRFDAAAGLAILARELCEEVRVLAFTETAGLGYGRGPSSGIVWELPPRRGFALRDALFDGPWNGTPLGAAVQTTLLETKPERIIVITDEQAQDGVPAVTGPLRAYMVNVAPYKNGVASEHGWEKINGWSEAIFDYIVALEQETAA